MRHEQEENLPVGTNVVSNQTLIQPQSPQHIYSDGGTHFCQFAILMLFSVANCSIKRIKKMINVFSTAHAIASWPDSVHLYRQTTRMLDDVVNLQVILEQCPDQEFRLPVVKRIRLCAVENIKRFCKERYVSVRWALIESSVVPGNFASKSNIDPDSGQLGSHGAWIYVLLYPLACKAHNLNNLVPSGVPLYKLSPLHFWYKVPIIFRPLGS